MIPAYACKVSKENLKVIVSESGRRFDLEYLEGWLAENTEGYFLRDETSVLDCTLFADAVFFDMYAFKSPDTANLFRQVVKL